MTHRCLGARFISIFAAEHPTKRLICGRDAALGARIQADLTYRIAECPGRLSGKRRSWETRASYTDSGPGSVRRLPGQDWIDVMISTATADRSGALPTSTLGTKLRRPGEPVPST